MINKSPQAFMNRLNKNIKLHNFPCAVLTGLIDYVANVIVDHQATLYLKHIYYTARLDISP